MIFRRIKAHIEKENWFAVLIDFLIVVVGVFIGLQVANWNEARGERALALHYVEQLAEDIKADIVDISVGLKTAQWRYAAIYTLLKKTDSPLPNSIVNPEREIELPALEFVYNNPSTLINAVSYTRFLDGDRPAYSSLLSAGNANLIANLPSFQCIQSYYALHDETAKFEGRLLLFRTEFIRAMHEAGVSIAGVRDEQDLVERINSNESLAASMASFGVFSWFQVDVLQHLQRRAVVLLETLDAGSDKCELNAEKSL
jgi:hypothetical protein